MRFSQLQVWIPVMFYQKWSKHWTRYLNWCSSGPMYSNWILETSSTFPLSQALPALPWLLYVHIINLLLCVLENFDELMMNYIYIAHFSYRYVQIRFTISSMCLCNYILSLDYSIFTTIAILLFKVKRSTVSEKHPDAVRLGSNVEDDENLGLRKTEPDLEPIVDWDLQDGAGYEGLCVASRVNVTARIQRTYWRSVQARDQSLNSAR